MCIFFLQGTQKDLNTLQLHCKSSPSSINPFWLSCCGVCDKFTRSAHVICSLFFLQFYEGLRFLIKSQLESVPQGRLNVIGQCNVVKMYESQRRPALLSTLSRQWCIICNKKGFFSYSDRRGQRGLFLGWKHKTATFKNKIDSHAQLK